MLVMDNAWGGGGGGGLLTFSKTFHSTSSREPDERSTLQQL